MNSLIRRATAQTSLIVLATLLLSPQIGRCFFNPSTGRWLSRDPANDQREPSMYGFVRNQPGKATDPLGLCQCEVTEPLSVRLTPPNNPIFPQNDIPQNRGPLSDPIWDGSWDGDGDGNPDGWVSIWFTMRAQFNNCCEFRQERSGKIVVDGITYADYPNFADDGYSRAADPGDYHTFPDGTILFGSYDNPNAPVQVHEHLSLWMGFKGYIIDVCPYSPTFRKHVGPDRLYGWNIAQGDLARGIVINTYGFDDH